MTPDDKRPQPYDAPTSDQLRHEIDAGAGGDKIPGGDPAAAPLGVDDEAAGTPPTREQLARAEAQEITGRPAHSAHPAAAAGEPARKAPRSLWVGGVAILAVLVILAVIFAA